MTPRNRWEMATTLPQEDAARVREVRRDLRIWVDGAPSALTALTPQLPKLLRAEKSAAYGLLIGEQALSLHFVHSIGFAHDAWSDFARMLETQGLVGALYNPVRPQPGQRNRALALRNLTGRSKLGEVTIPPFFRRSGLADFDQLRTLVCDGESLLGLVAVFRPEPFRAAERAVLDAITPAMQRRLLFERMLGDSALHFAGMVASLEAIGSAAFIVTSNGAIKHANAVGRARPQRERCRLEADLRHAVTGDKRCDQFDVLRLLAPGFPPHFLVIERLPPDDPRTRLASIARRWQLTPRQTEVMELLAHGEANKTIAAVLGCAERTVELHVTALLAKAEVDSRSALVAKFWRLRAS